MDHHPVDRFVLGDGGQRCLDAFALEHEAGVERVAHGGAGDRREFAEPLLGGLAEPGDGDAGAVADVGGEHRDAAAAAEHRSARAFKVGHSLDGDREVEQLVDALGAHEAGLTLDGVPDLGGAGERAGV